MAEVFQFKRLAKKRWAGVPKYTNARDGIAPFLDRRTGYPVTGLTQDDEKRLEKALGMKEGELSPRSAYWDEFFIPFGDEILYLRMDNPEDELKILFLKRHKLVANGHEGLKTKAGAEYVIYTEVDEAKSTNRRHKVKKEAYAHFSKMTATEMIDTLIVMHKYSGLVGVNPEIVEAKLGSVIESNLDEFYAVISDPRFRTRVFLMKLVKFGVIQKGKGQYENAPFFFDEEFMGEGWEAAVAWLELPSHQQMRVTLQSKLDYHLKLNTAIPQDVVTPKGESLAMMPSNKEVQKKAVNAEVDLVVVPGVDSGDYPTGELPVTEDVPDGIGRGNAKAGNKRR